MRAAFAVLACALAVAAAGAAVAATGAGGSAPAAPAGTAESAEPALSTGGSTVGIKVESALPEPGEDFQGNDSNLGIRVTSAASEDVSVVFRSQGRVYYEQRVSYGSYAVAPSVDPAWDWSAAGRDPAEGEPDPAFDCWCVDDAGEVAWDFSRPVTEDAVLYAGWNEGKRVTVALRGCGGTMEDPATGGQTGELAITRYAGSTYRSLPEPACAGHAFGGWWTADGSETGEWGVAVGADTPVASVSEADHALYAKWAPVTYYVNYLNNEDGTGGGPSHEEAVVWGGGGRFLEWDVAKKQHGFVEPHGYRFSGWNARADGSGAWYHGGSAIDPDLADAAGAHVPVYAQWAPDGTVDSGPFDVTFVYGDGATPDTTVSVEKGGKAGEPETPKRPGWQFAGWYSDGSFVNEWDFDAQVHGDLTLWAKWDLRLDVTVPVSVGFAVDADTGEATGPGEDRYALKSRTVAPVVVEEAALESRQEELEGFFELKDGTADAGVGGGAGDAWAAALEKTELSLGAGGETVALPFAGEAGTADGAEAWKSSHTLDADERAAFRMEPFSYTGTAFDAAWQGGIPCKELPLKLGMTIPMDKLKVKTAVDGPQKVTRLVLTVSAKA